MILSKLDEIVETFELLEEARKKRRKAVRKKKLLEDAEEKRKERSKNCEIISHSSEPSDDITTHTFEIASSEKTESDSHTVVLEIFNKSGRINSMICSCADFASRYQYWKNKEGVSSFKENLAINDYFNPHSEEKPKITNPDNDMGSACKHILKAVEFLENEER